MTQTDSYQTSQERLATFFRQRAAEVRAEGDADHARYLLRRAHWAETTTVAPVGHQPADDRELYS